jgi:hypothetical protein
MQQKGPKMMNTMTAEKATRWVVTCSLGFYLLLLPACNRAEADWNKAVQANTPDAYRDFAHKHPATDRLLSAKGKFSGHSIMVGKDGRLRGGVFGMEPPEFEIRSESDPGFVFKMSVGDAFSSGILKDHKLELAATYTYTDAEMIVLRPMQDTNAPSTLVYFNCSQVSSVADGGNVKSSSARTVKALSR